MNWLILALGILLLMSGILGQVYSLKTKRGVLHPRTRIWRLLVRSVLFLAGLLLVAMAVGRIVLHPRNISNGESTLHFGRERANRSAFPPRPPNECVIPTEA